MTEIYQMLRKITASGFKSLVNFELELVPGLNVLVGPNGAGKTNVLKLLEFLSELASGTASQAISKCGGAGDIFFRDEDNKLGNCISFSIAGGSLGIPLYYRRKRQKIAIEYFYSASVKLSRNSVFFSRQEIGLKIGKENENRDGFDLHCSWAYDKDSASIESDYITLNQPQLKEYCDIDDTDIAVFRKMLTNEHGLSEQAIFQALSHFVGPFNTLSLDVASGRAYNIIPSKVRENEDIAKRPGISADGSGLASTLYALKQQNDYRQHEPQYPFYYTGGRWMFPAAANDQVQSYVRLINDSIDGVEATQDPIENRNRVQVNISQNGRKSVLPISLVSDGTVKWISLIAAVVTSRTAFCIEEPENFLHPRLQEEIVSIVRATSENPETERFALITTHSQTLLNALRPEEIIVTSNDGEGTHCRRPENAEVINRLINETGFGLGYFYLQGALQG